MQVLILEASTTSAKAMLYDDQAGVIRWQSLPYDAAISDVYTHDADRLYALLMRVGRQVAQGSAVSCVALVGSWHTMLACDRQMQPLCRVLTWNSTAAAQCAREIRSIPSLSSALYRTTGCMPHAIYPLYMIRSLRAEGFSSPSVQFLMEDSYLFYRMTGQRRTTVSSASGASLLDIAALRYGTLPLEIAGIDAAQLPPLCDHTLTAPLTPGSAELLDIPAGTPVCAAHPDGAMNQLGCGALRPGVMTLSVGTSAAMRMAAPSPETTLLNGTWCYYAPTTWLIGAATSGATNCVDWFMHQLAGDLSYAQLERDLSLRPDSPLFLPYLYGERCPGWNDSACGSFDGLSGRHTRKDLYAALLEGVAFSIAQCFDRLTASYRRPEKILLSGGILKSGFWVSMLVDILGQPVLLSPAEQASMLGGAAIALFAAGATADLQAPQTGATQEQTIEPDPKKHAFYRERFVRWTHLYDALTANLPKTTTNL